MSKYEVIVIKSYNDLQKLSDEFDKYEKVTISTLEVCKTDRGSLYVDGVFERRDVRIGHEVRLYSKDNSLKVGYKNTIEGWVGFDEDGAIDEDNILDALLGEDASLNFPSSTKYGVLGDNKAKVKITVEVLEVDRRHLYSQYK
jgi:hypothetical protein